MMKAVSFAALVAALLLPRAGVADTVYITARPSPTGTGANFDGTYLETVPGSDTSAKGTALGAPARDGSRFFSNTFSNAVEGIPGFTLTPTLGVPGGVYQIHHNFSATAGNVSTDLVLTAVCTTGGTLSFSDTGTNFQRAAGNPASKWMLLGYVTNAVDSANPSIDFGYLSGHVSAGASQRLLVDVFRFTLFEPCLNVPVVGVTGPLSADVNQVVVTGVAEGATAVTVYQNTGSGMVAIGTKTADIVAGNNTVAVTGLVKGASVAATQTLDGQEGCTPTAGLLVGGGANPRIRIALSIRETDSTGPAGAPGNTASANIHFLGATATLAGSPVGGLVVHPSNTWQTVSFERGNVVLGESSNVLGTASPGGAYAGGDKATIKVFASMLNTNTGLPFYSPVGATSPEVTSAEPFTVNWTWAAVDGATGYRLLRDINGGGFTEFADTTETAYSDDSGWSAGSEVTPNAMQTTPSIRWNGTGTNPNAIPGNWGVLDAVALAIDDLTDVGPYDLYIDNLQNGETVWQSFEASETGATDVGFRPPTFSGTTSGNLLNAPSLSAVTDATADTGTKSFRVRFQWSGTNETRWVRLTTSGVGNPQVNLDEPISFRLLLLPVGSSPQPPVSLSLAASRVDGKVVLNWTGTHQLQASDAVTGTFTNVPGATTAPWTNVFTGPQMFFRLTE